MQEYIDKFNLDKILTKDILPFLRLKHYDDNQIIMYEGDTIEFLYFVVEGTVKVSSSNLLGKVALIEEMSALSILGDIEYETTHVIYHNVFAVNGCTCILVPIDILKRFFYKNEYFLKFMVSQLSDKVSKMSVKHENSMLMSLKSRILKYLQVRTINKNTTTITVSLSNIANYLGVTIRQVSRIFKELEEENIIIKKNKTVQIIDMALCNDYIENN